MTCSTACRCQCGQVACGCQGRRPRAAAATPSRSGTRETAKCRMCESLAIMQGVRSVSGKVVIVILCPQCDTITGRRKR